jgi:hypothetical protein
MVFLVFYKVVKLIMSYVLNRGIKDIQVNDITGNFNERRGTYRLGVGAVITIEPKTVLTPKEVKRKRMIILFLISLAFMVGLSTAGAWLPNAQAGLGRTLILLSEIPAFGYSLLSTRFLMKKGPRKIVS